MIERSRTNWQMELKDAMPRGGRGLFPKLAAAKNNLFLRLQSPCMQARKLLGWRLRHPVYLALVYVLATVLTSAFFMGDTADYVTSVLKGDDFWDTGHLLWRPLGWILYEVLKPISQAAVGADARAQVTLVFVSVSWIAGLACVLLLRGFLLQVVKNHWAVDASVIAFIFSQSFLNYSHAGSPYIPALALLLSGFYLLAVGADTRNWSTPVFSGLALALAVGMWLPFVLAIPAALVSPLLLVGFDRPRLRLAFWTAVSCALFILLIYGLLTAHIGIQDSIASWTKSSSYNVEGKGISRVLFGLPRSLINLGSDGVLFKRFLLRDPYNPVGVFDLLRMSLWKLGCIYTLAFCALVNLLRSGEGKRALGLLIVNAVPLIGFAIYFLGADVERYLPLYVTIFLSLSVCFSKEKSSRWLNALSLAVLTIMIVTNVLAMATVTLNHKQEMTVARIRELQPRLTPKSLVLTFSQGDELVIFNRNFPFNPINQGIGLSVRPTVILQSIQVARWREGLATDSLAAWEQGGSVWVSKRLSSPRPLAQWNWCEGDDRRVKWNDLYEFFSQFEIGESIGGDDGFTLLMPSFKNGQLLMGLIEDHRIL